MKRNLSLVIIMAVAVLFHSQFLFAEDVVQDLAVGGATDALDAIISKNKEGQDKYQKVADFSKTQRDAFAKAGAACAASCSFGGCCSDATWLFGTAAGFAVVNELAKRQVKEHIDSGASACQSLNQLSSTAKDCKPTPPKEVNVSFNPLTGECTPADSELCKQQSQVAGVIPPLVKDKLKANGFPGFNGSEIPKVQPDGSVKTADGKTFKASDFDSPASLGKLGFSPGDAKNLFDKIGQIKANMDKELKTASKPGGGFNSSSNSGFGSYSAVTKPANKDTTSDQLKAVEPKDRTPSSEGLVKEFNGELIGVSGDDIFLMMNRRYKLKKDQDSFIAQ